MTIPVRNRREFLAAGEAAAVTAFGYATGVHASAVFSALEGGPRPVAATR